MGKNDLVSAGVSDIFFSYQGEGLFIGEPQIFVRFAECNLRCFYCDEKFIERKDDKSVDYVLKKIREKVSTAGTGVKTISLTGGEPLLYTNFLKRLLPEIKKLGLRVYLETNGTLPENYRLISKFINTVAMDIKLPSDSGGCFWNRHKTFIKLAKKKIFIKIVLTSKTKQDEFKRAIKMMKDIDKNIPVVLQPVTPHREIKSVSPENLYKFLSFAKKNLRKVFVIPQLHKLLWRIK